MMSRFVQGASLKKYPNTQIEISRKHVDIFAQNFAVWCSTKLPINMLCYILFIYPYAEMAEMQTSKTKCVTEHW